MTKRIYTSAKGVPIDMDSLQIANEQTIAVGNMKVNARGDELGPGGQVTATRNQNMQSYYKLHSDMPVDAAVPDEIITRQKRAGASIGGGVPKEAPGIDPQPVANIPEAVEQELEPQAPVAVASTRGSLASSVAKPATVTQELMKPLNKRNGVTRI
jgi:hypothetical protein